MLQLRNVRRTKAGADSNRRQIDSNGRRFDSSREEMSPFPDRMSPLLREMSPFLRDLSLFLREMSPFSDEISPFRREVRPFQAAISPDSRAVSPLGSQMRLLGHSVCLPARPVDPSCVECRGKMCRNDANAAKPSQTIVTSDGAITLFNVGWDQLASSAGPPSGNVEKSWWAGGR